MLGFVSRWWTVSLVACALTGCTRLNPGFGDDKGGTDSGTSDTTPGETTVGADASTGSMSGSSTTKPTSTTSEDTIDEDTTSATRASETTHDDVTSAASDTSETTHGSGSDEESSAGGPPADLGDGLCGDGELDRGEECDSEVPAAVTCESFGYQTGLVTCTNECTIELHCCGDDSIDPAEVCQPGEVIECPPYADEEDTLLECTDECQVPEPGCPACGDHVVQPEVEDCDFEGQLTCDDLDLGGGASQISCVNCLYSSNSCCIPDGEPCSLGKGISCCLGSCSGAGFCGAA